MSKRKSVQEDDEYDNGLCGQLDTILQNYKETNDSSELEQFVSRGFQQQVIQSWSYYAEVSKERSSRERCQMFPEPEPEPVKLLKSQQLTQTANHGKMTSSSLVVAGLISALDTPITAAKALAISRDILENYMKVINRALYICRPGVTNPAIAILTAIVSLQKGQLAAEMLSHFDFTIKVMSTLLAPAERAAGTSGRDRSMRETMVRFLCAWIANGNSLVKKDIFDKRRMRASWIRHFASDSAALIELQLNTWKDHILMDAEFSKTTKRTVFNEWTLGNIAMVLSRQDPVAARVCDFLVFVGTDSTNGILYPCDGWWSDELREAKKLVFDETYQRNYQGFNMKIRYATEEDIIKYKHDDTVYRNKLLISVLKSNVRAWDNVNSQRLCLSILEAAPELVHPLMTYHHWPSFDPKLTSFWVGLVAFYSRLLELPIPAIMAKRASTRDCPPIDTVIESVLPSGMTKSALTKGLGSEIPLIRQLTAQVLNLALQKYTKVLAFIQAQPGWESGAVQLREEFVQRFINISTVFTAITVEKKPGLTRYNLVAVASKFADLFSEHVPKSSLPSHLLTDITASGLSIAEFRYTMNLQGKLAMTEWWWKKSAGSSNSLFTLLLQLCTSESKSVTQSVSASLAATTAPTMLFQTKLAISSLDVLVNSLSVVENSEPVLALIDEAVGRFMRGPYKYLDIISALCKDNNLDPNKTVFSPFLAVLAEQVKHVKVEPERVQIWLSKLCRDACIAGESWELIQALCAKFSLDSRLVTKEPNTDLSNELLWGTDSEKDLEKRNLSYFDLALAVKAKHLLSDSSALPESNFDASALAYRARGFKKSQLASFGVKLRMAGMISPSLRAYLASPEFQEAHFDSDMTQFYAQLIRSIYEGVSEIKTDFQVAFADKIGSMLAEGADNGFLQSFVWTFTAGQALTYVQILMKNKEDITKALEVLAGVSGGFLSAEELFAVEKYVRKKCPQNSSLVADILLSNLSTLESLDKERLDDILSSTYKKPEAISVVSALAQIPSAKKKLTKLVSKSVKKLPAVHLAQLLLITGVPADLAPAVAEKMTEYLCDPQDLGSIDTLAQILVECNLPVEDASRILTSLTAAPKTHGYSQNVGRLVARCESPELTKYLSKGIINLTKHLMETEEEAIYESALDVARCLDEVALGMDFWSHVSAKAVNALLEAVVSKWFHDPVCIRLVHSLTSCASKQIEHSKLFQMAIHSPANCLLHRDSASYESQVLTSTIVQKLFSFNRNNSNPGVVNGVLQLYMARNTLPDQILLAVLQAMESVGSYNWTQHVFSWTTTTDVRDNRVVSVINGDIEVSLAAPTVLQSIVEFDPREKYFGDRVKAWNAHSAASQRLAEPETAAYDPSFLMGAVAQMIPLSGDLDIRSLCDNYYLGFVIASLASWHPSTVAYSKALLEAISHCLDSPYKTPEKGLAKIMVRKCLFAMAQEDVTRLPNIVATQLAYMSKLFAFPAHVMFDDTVNLVLAGPQFYTNVVPIATRVFGSGSTDYFRKIAWCLDTFIAGVKNPEDVKMVVKQGLLEQLMTSCASPTVPDKVKELVIRLMWSIQAAGTGTATVIKRYGGLAWTEMLDGDMTRLVQTTAARFGVTFANKEKLLSWTSNDFPQYLRRQIKS